MIKYATLILTLLTLGLLALITFASGTNLSQLSSTLGSFFNITLYSPIDNMPIIIKNSYVQAGGHFFVFLLAGLTVRQWLINQSPWTCLIILWTIAGLSELGQSLAIDRSTSWDDFAINILAGSIGIFISNALRLNNWIARVS